MSDIVTLTLNPAIDGASETDAVRHTRKVRTSHETYEPGGGGINVLRVLRELGAEATAVYLSGGVTGPILDALMQHMQLRSERIGIADHTRISHTVYERASGREYRFVPEGPQIASHEWQAALSAVSGIAFRFLVASGSLPRGVPDDFYVRLAKIVGDKGATFILDTSGDALRESVRAGGVDLIKPSLGELESLVGRSLPEPQQQEEAAMDVIRSGNVRAMAVTLGHRGAFLAQAGGVFRVPAIETEVRSAVGAGDSFVGAMTASLSRGEPLEIAFRWGVAAGTAAVGSPGTQLIRRSDVERFFASFESQAE